MFRQRCPRCKSSRIQYGYNDAPLRLRLVGVNELLCNNCNLEFRGFALPGTLKREASSRAETGDNRRRAPRFKARLPVSISLVEVDQTRMGVRYSEELEGQSRTVSAVGLSVELPESEAWGERLNGSSRRLRIRLSLPGGPIHLHIAPVYQEKLAETGREIGRLVAGPITKIETTDRARLLAYLQTLRES